MRARSTAPFATVSAETPFSPKPVNLDHALGLNDNATQGVANDAKVLGQRRPESHAILFHDCGASGDVPDKRRVPQKTLCYAHDILCNHSVRQAQYNNP